MKENANKGFKAFNTENKLNLNISDKAQRVIQQDMAEFGKEESYGSFINKIVLKYYSHANATLSELWKRKYNEYYGRLCDLPEDKRTHVYNRVLRDKLKKDQREIAAEIMANHAVLSLKHNVIDRYPKGSSDGVLNKKKIYIDKGLMKVLADVGETSVGSLEGVDAKGGTTEKPVVTVAYMYNGRAAAYVKAVVEEYVRLPYAQRERIYFKERVEAIENAISSGCKLQFVAASNSTLVVKPYRLLTDKHYTFNYLVAWLDNTEDVLPFRISNMRNVQIKTANITQERQDLLISKKEREDQAEREKDRGAAIEKMLQDTDVSFIGEALCTVKVKLTKEGVKTYNTILHLRPSLIRREGEDGAENNDGNIFVFNCTLRQAQYYFEKFGPKALILEPEKLRNYMKQMYEEAAQQYN